MLWPRRQLALCAGSIHGLDLNAVENIILFVLRGRFYFPRRHMSRPGFSRLGLVVDGFPGDGRNSYKMIAAGALDLPSRVQLLTGQMLMAMRTLKFEFAHTELFYSYPDFNLQAFCNNPAWSDKAESRSQPSITVSARRPIPVRKDTPSCSQVISFSIRSISSRMVSVTRCLI